jgi:hypothetical protein
MPKISISKLTTKDYVRFSRHKPIEYRVCGIPKNKFFIRQDTTMLLEKEVRNKTQDYNAYHRERLKDPEKRLKYARSQIKFWTKLEKQLVEYLSDPNKQDTE